jgi:hypothetical protein
LRDGSADARGASAALADLSAEQWVGLEQLVAAFFRECQSYAPPKLFPAFWREVEQRGRGFRY